MDSERLEDIKQGIAGWTKTQNRREGTKGVKSCGGDGFCPLRWLGVNAEGLRAGH